MSYVAVRVKPLKKWSDVSNASRHGKREDPATHVDRTRTHLNRHWAVSGSCEFEEHAEPTDIEAAFNITAGIAGASWRKGAIVGTEMLFIASPEFFNDYESEWDALDGKPGKLNLARAHKWAEDCLAAAHDKFPDQIAAARLDLDEKTPHLSVFLLPMYEKSYEGEKRRSNRQRAPRKAISHNQAFGSPEKLSALQDWISGEMTARGYALQRGRHKRTKYPDHLTPAEGRRRIAAAEQEAKRIIEQATKEAERLRSAQANEVAQLREHVRQLEALVKTIRTVLRQTLPEMFAKLQAAINDAWSKDPENPDRKQESASSPKPTPSSPAPGQSM